MADCTDKATGVSFPAKARFWHGGELTCLGAGCRIKKVALMSIKAYAVAQYVDVVGAAAARLKDPADLLQNGAFDRVLQMHLVRDVTGAQFTNALDEGLRPNMKGNEGVLDSFCAYFAGRQLANGTNVVMMRRADGATDVVLRAPDDKTPFSETPPGVSIADPCLGKALWGIYMGPKAPAPDACKAWLAALPPLIGA